MNEIFRFVGIRPPVNRIFRNQQQAYSRSGQYNHLLNQVQDKDPSDWQLDEELTEDEQQLIEELSQLPELVLDSKDSKLASDQKTSISAKIEQAGKTTKCLEIKISHTFHLNWLATYREQLLDEQILLMYNHRERRQSCSKLEFQSEAINKFTKKKQLFEKALRGLRLVFPNDVDNSSLQLEVSPELVQIARKSAKLRTKKLRNKAINENLKTVEDSDDELNHPLAKNPLVRSKLLVNHKRKALVTEKISQELAVKLRGLTENLSKLDNSSMLKTVKQQTANREPMPVVKHESRIRRLSLVDRINVALTGKLPKKQVANKSSDVNDQGFKKSSTYTGSTVFTVGTRPENYWENNFKKAKDILNDYGVDENLFQMMPSSNINDPVDKEKEYQAAFMNMVDHFDSCEGFSPVRHPFEITPHELLLSEIKSELEGVDIYGFMDLYKVTEELARYDATELAHIENVLKGETRERVHNHYRSTEEFSSEEEEQEKDITKDLQSTSRSELTEESENIVSTEFEVDAGLNVSATYGGVGFSINVDANANVHYGSSTEQTNRSASTIAREIINKTTERIKSKKRTLSSVKEIVRVEERNLHRMDGKTDNSAVYYWVDRIEEVSLKNYGKRLIISFIIPEPGVRLWKTYQEISDLTPPTPFTLNASQINENNYLALAHQYSAKVKPPPTKYLKASLSDVAEAETETDSNKAISNYSFAGSIKIPQGYYPIDFAFSGTSDNLYFYYLSHAEDPDRAAVKPVLDQALDPNWHVSLGGVTFITNGVAVNTAFSTYNTLRTMLYPGWQVDVATSDGIAVHVRLFNTLKGNAGFTLGLLCERSCDLYHEWQINTHDAISNAYQRRLAKYNDDLENERRSRGIHPIGGTPAQNRAIERDELKRFAKSILKQSPIDYDLFAENGRVESIDYDALDEFENDISYFEENFEWSQATWKLFPYYYSRRDQWSRGSDLLTPDPKHAKFLNAGAARLLVPIKPGQERPMLAKLAEILGVPPVYVSHGDVDSLYFQFPDIISELPPAVPDAAPELWAEPILDSKEDVVLGQGTLNVTHGDSVVEVPDVWELNQSIDVNREVWIAGKVYTIKQVSPADKKILLDRPIESPTDPSAVYLISAALVAPPWEVKQATQLVILASQRDKLKVL